MNHAGMNHAGMNHGDMPSANEPHCSMNMSFTWSYQDLCIIFKWWHIHTQMQMFLSCAAIMALAMHYEWVKYRLARRASEGAASPGRMPSRERLRRALGYGAQVAFSFMLMLVFMTYNGWLMLAVVAGAAAGYYRWGDAVASFQGENRSLACH